MIGKVIGGIVEKVSTRTGIPLGGIWLLFLLCSAIVSMKESGIVTRDGEFIKIIQCGHCGKDSRWRVFVYVVRLPIIFFGRTQGCLKQLEMRNVKSMKNRLESPREFT